MSQTNGVLTGQLTFIKGVRWDGKAHFAHGGNAEIYRGELDVPEDGKKTTRLVAIKIFRGMHIRTDAEKAKIMKRIEREEKNLIAAKHPNVALFYGVSEAGLVTFAPSAPGLVTLYYPNENVMKYLEDHPDKSLLNDRLRLIRDVAKGLAHLHGIPLTTDRTRVMVHGDVKPANVLVDNNGSAVLCDFGLSRIIEETGYTTHFNYTAKYLDPKLISAEETSSKSTNPECDVYSFGMTALEIVSGVEPYHNVKNAAFLPVLINNGKKPLREDHPMPDKLWDIIISCWLADQKNRPKMSKVLEMLSKMEELA